MLARILRDYLRQKFSYFASSQMYLPKHSRKRGVVLSSYGLQKLKTAKSQAEIRENASKRYTLAALSFRTELTPNTLMKVLAGDVGVDKHTLSRCFGHLIWY